jgi:hypothetical protein
MIATAYDTRPDGRLIGLLLRILRVIGHERRSCSASEGVTTAKKMHKRKSTETKLISTTSLNPRIVFS